MRGEWQILNWNKNMIDIQKINQDLVSELNIKDLPEQVQNDIIDGLGQNILEKVILELIKKIPEDKREVFDSLRDPKEIQTFVSEYIPDYDGFVQSVVNKEITEFKQEAGLV